MDDRHYFDLNNKIYLNNNNILFDIINQLENNNQTN